MMPGGALAQVFGPLVGAGRGAGMALMFVLFGGLALLVSVASFMVRDIRDVEVLIPDYVPPDEEVPGEAISVPVGTNADN
jgi:hypothetical protein